jgi:hypothetical protein
LEIPDEVPRISVPDQLSLITPSESPGYDAALKEAGTNAASGLKVSFADDTANKKRNFDHLFDETGEGKEEERGEEGATTTVGNATEVASASAATQPKESKEDSKLAVNVLPLAPVAKTIGKAKKPRCKAKAKPKVAKKSAPVKK